MWTENCLLLRRFPLFWLFIQYKWKFCLIFCRFPLFWHPVLRGFTLSLLWSLISSPFRPLWKHSAKVSKEKINWDIYCMNCKAGSLIESHIKWKSLISWRCFETYHPPSPPCMYEMNKKAKIKTLGFKGIWSQDLPHVKRRASHCTIWAI